MSAQHPSHTFDPAAFAADLDALRARVIEELGPEDAAHLRKIERWSRACSALGYGTAWIAPNLFSMGLISTGRVSRWTMVAHHVLHRGYDRVPGVPRSRTSKVFGKGWRRLVDWMDWIEPEAWAYEHNQLHHYHLSEDDDPDNVEINLAWLRDSNLSRRQRLALVSFFLFSWRWSYYAPNTFQQFRRAKAKRARQPDPGMRQLYHEFLESEMWLKYHLPWVGLHLVAIPAMFTPLGPWAVFSVWANSVGAEALANLHSFAIIVTNHAGDDLEIYDTPIDGKAEFYRRQAAASVNFRTGGDVNDFLHGWLNYQIEHHLFPDLPMSAYQRIQPEVQALCEKHGVPYIQESVFTRFKKTVKVIVGDDSMVRVDQPVDAAAK